MKRLKKLIAVFEKNFRIQMHNKKKFFGYTMNACFPLIFAILYQRFKISFPSLQPILNMILRFYLSTAFSVYCVQACTTLVTERQEKFRQYQKIMGLDSLTYIIGNIGYLTILTVIFSSPVVLYLFFYELFFGYFLLLVVGIINTFSFAMLLSSFFTDFKISTTTTSLILAFGSFVTFGFQPQNKSVFYYLCMIFPNSNYSVGITEKSLSYLGYSLTSTFVALLLFSIIEFRFNPFSIINIFRKSKKSKNLIEELQLGENTLGSSSLNDEIYISSTLQEILQSSGISKKYEDFQALKNISIKIKKSQIFGLLGRNGSGKTTFVDIITGIIKQSQGRFSLKTFSNNPLGICYQKQILYEDLTPLQHFSIYAKLKSFDQDFNSVFQKIGLQQHINKKVKQLSGGNKRKLSVGLAILGRPQLIIFDEPTSGLDPHSRRQLWEILKNLRHLNSTVLLTTHHLDEADYLSDKICVIQKGQVITQGTPRQIKSKYGCGYHLVVKARKSIQNWNKCKQIVTKTLKNVQLIDQEKNVIKFFIELNYNNQTQISDILQKLQENQDFFISLQANTLEHSFLSIIRNVSGANKPLEQQIFHRSGSSSTFMGRIIAIFLRMLYAVRFSPVLSLLNYTINLLIIAIYYLMIQVTNSFINDLIEQQNSQSNKIEYDPNNYGNLVYIAQLFLIPVFIAMPVYQKEKKIRHVLQTRGVYFVQYWVGTFAFHYIAFLLNSIGIYAYSRAGILPQLNISLYLGTGVGIILLAYTASYIFDKAKTAANWSFFLTFLFGYFIIPLVFLVKIYPEYQKLLLLRVLYPPFDLMYWSLQINKVNKEFLVDLQFQSLPFSIGLYIGLIFFIEFGVYQRIKLKLQQNNPVERVNSLVKFDNVTHTYNRTTTALSNVNFEINQERIALLGHNGAGKSTAFDLLTYQLNQTNGNIYMISKLKMPYQYSLNSVGVCYQTDALWQDFSTDQIMNIFCKIQGVKNVKAQKDFLFDNLQFEYTHKTFKYLSGGNKRKMCMVVALIGDPRVILLDQCSTGLDPSSRQSMVSTIKSSGNGRNAIIFTTHSLPEAEQLCLKSLILDKGVIKQFGENYQIKQKYFSCYWVQLCMKKQVEMRQKQMQENMQTEAYKQISQLSLPFQFKSIKDQQNVVTIEIQKSAVKLSKLFLVFSSLKQKHKIKQFRICEPSLQDVYLKIVGQEPNQH